MPEARTIKGSLFSVIKKVSVLEGKIQDRATCEGLKKNFGDLVKIINTSCQVPFKATKK